MLLALAEKGGRIRVDPAPVIPVIDVLADDDQFDIFDGLFPIDLREQLVGRGTTGAPFGGE